MDTSSLYALSLVCAPWIHPATVQAMVTVESAGNPYAIGVVGGALRRQPRSAAQALSTIRQLQLDGWDFSVGLAQIHQTQWPRLHLTAQQALEPCANLQAMQTVLMECADRA